MLTSLAPLALALAAGPDEWIIPPGTVETYDTADGRLCLKNLVIGSGARLRVVGDQPFQLVVSNRVQIDGILDLSGEDSPGVLTLNTTHQPERGAAGRAGGGDGGTGSRQVHQSTPRGGTGYDDQGRLLGGRGGETGYATSGKDDRRGAGGGGGALGPNRPVHPDRYHPSNLGRLALDGRDGGPGGLGAQSQSAPAAGGSAGSTPFVDADLTNDFWGVKRTSQGPIVGELAGPLAGRGGGAGGDASDTASFPSLPFDPSGDEKGSGGGGGGGLGLVLAREIGLGPDGAIRVDGGDGGGGENTLFFDRVGGGSGGGSGGMLVLESALFDLANAADGSISALGGRGGPGRDGQHGKAVGAGGNGGPGLIQLHTPDGTDAVIALPPSKTLGDLTAPEAHVLEPVLGG